MGLHLGSIKLRNFRNYSEFDSGEFSIMNIFVGRNGVGKTNIIEAIQLMTGLESFRKPKWNEIVRWGCEDSEVIAREVGDQRDLEVRLYVKDGKRRYFLNGKGKKRGDLLGQLPAVVFCPDDLQMVKGYSEVRRDALDSVGSQISSTYADLRSDYMKAVRQKNALLQSGTAVEGLLDPWNESLSVLGSGFVKHRLNLFAVMRKAMVESCLEMSGNLLSDMVYIPSWEEKDGVELRESEPSAEEIQEKIYRKMSSLRTEEIYAKRVLVGPHRDDIRFYLDGHDARKFASQGQQRLISLVWKIAEMKTISNLCGQAPILLLDDVMSELDREKREMLVDYLSDDVQTFITSVELERMDGRHSSDARVFELSG